jgi:hypothetical protein
MILSATVLSFVLSSGPLVKSPQVSGSAQTVACTDWRECRQQALDAAERGDYEAFHDLAWRAVQTGPVRDPDLMYQLARAQCLSGRPHDSLVMLRRLADMGVATDASTNEDFRGTRELAGWPEVEALIERARDAGGSVPVKLPPTSPLPVTVGANETRATPVPAAPGAKSVPPAAAGVARAKPIQVEETLRFTTERFEPGGFAHDVVSGRFLFGDLRGRKLMVVAEGGTSTVDMVRADSAGFHDVMALEIDARRGDLWVASAMKDGGAGAVHKLQLISGRPLKTFPAPSELEPVKFSDLAINGAGAVFVLESLRGQVLVLRPGGTSLELFGRIDALGTISLAAAGEDGVIYVAHREGISRIDAKNKAAAALTSRKGIDLGNFERIRWHRRALVGVQAAADGSRRIVRLELNASGKSVTSATIFDASVPATAEPTFVALSGDSLSYLTVSSSSTAQRQGSDSTRPEFVVRRIPLQ